VLEALSDKVSIEKRTKSFYAAAVLFLLGGILAILDGAQITSFSRPSGDTPYWVVLAMGIVFVCASAVMFTREDSSWSYLLVSMMTAIFGIVGLWAIFFANESGFRWELVKIYQATGIPIHQILLAICTAPCFVISIFFFKKFVAKCA
jgi:hypothetical protein